MSLTWHTGKVIRIVNETSNTRRYWIEVPELQAFDFEPGQFVTLDLPIHEKPNKRWRSYSIASWPDGSNVFELVIVLLDGGAGTTWLFNEVKEGDQLTFRGPQGKFTLPEPIDRDLFFICTGTGIAPFRSMAHHILNHNITHQNIYLIFGCRKLTDNLYGTELEELAEKVTSFQYLPTFSREVPENYDHLIRTGYVHTIYEEIIRANSAQANTSPPALKPAYFYLCGWKNMIDEAKQRIQDLGYDRKTIHLELYG
ncbi:oxidoreductase [Niastella koreensis]|uniref:Ferredoxin--NAD(+) reductase n=2 Tax=Niastella koreensis TaxID=354356 RepID=G8TL36_NIAKG|nr:FAD-dependent oxidoreductase [Niastella koreensis]AEW01877.1 Ferredoxin--NAD(+) reductase [Niastella koreensis GR20-10]OQP48582.1 oxidoreductase [Niastella koreensis]